MDSTVDGVQSVTHLVSWPGRGDVAKRSDGLSQQRPVYRAVHQYRNELPRDESVRRSVRGVIVSSMVCGMAAEEQKSARQLSAAL